MIPGPREHLTERLEAEGTDREEIDAMNYRAMFSKDENGIWCVGLSTDKGKTWKMWDEVGQAVRDFFLLTELNGRQYIDGPWDSLATFEKDLLNTKMAGFDIETKHYSNYLTVDCEVPSHLEIKLWQPPESSDTETTPERLSGLMLPPEEVNQDDAP